jgi:glycolate oxidase FAD binding subunit
MSVAAIQEAVNACPPGRRLLPVAGGTKPALSATGRDDVDVLDVSDLRGVVEYDPAELTFTAQAATPVSEIAEALAEHGQYLPFEPPFAAAGATLGGVVAAGASGSGALRHGGVRDFVVGVRFVDGTGRVVNSGGRVVKNAAGFDLSKLMVGAMGRLGVLVQLSFKVFPRPAATTTLELDGRDTTTAVAVACKLAGGPRELEALDVLPGGRLHVRLGGDAGALPARAERLVAAAGLGAPVAVHDGEDEQRLWADAADLRWAGDATVVRVPIVAHEAPSLEQAVQAAGGEVRFGLAANVAWIAWPAGAGVDALDRLLAKAGLSGLVLAGPAGEPLVGRRPRHPFAVRVRQALDPYDRFLEV